jgi:hypothetical protein
LKPDKSFAYPLIKKKGVQLINGKLGENQYNSGETQTNISTQGTNSINDTTDDALAEIS